MTSKAEQTQSSQGGVVVGLMGATILTRFAMPDMRVDGVVAFAIAFVAVLSVFILFRLVYASGRIGRTLIMSFFLVTLPVSLLGVSVNLPVLGLIVGVITGILTTALFSPLPDTCHQNKPVEERGDFGDSVVIHPVADAETRSTYPIQSASGVASAFH